MHSTTRNVALALVAALAMAACRRQPQTVPTTTPPPSNPAPSETCDQRCQDSIANARAMAAAEEARRAEEARNAAIASVKVTLTQTIYFDYDQSDIRGDARSMLDAKLPHLRRNAAIQLMIAGHADERGSDQYNDALGQRRAAAAKRYLTDNGIDPNRISIVSYGESRPAVMGADENAWARNRRAEFSITAGEASITPPQL